MPSKHDPVASLADILENLERIEGYVAGLDREAFGGDTLRRDAVERCLERICEAAFRLGEKAAELAPSQPWGDIRGMGNRPGGTKQGARILGNGRKRLGQGEDMAVERRRVLSRKSDKVYFNRTSSGIFCRPHVSEIVRGFRCSCRVQT